MENALSEGAEQPSRRAVRIREYGNPSGPTVILLHGGPGAPGYLAPVAEALADTFRVLEPWQRGSGGPTLTVARHVDDLDAVVDRYGTKDAPVLVGHSWGAMLALAYAAVHPRRAASLVLVGCGTFDKAARREFNRACDARLTETERERLARLPKDIPDPDERLAARARLLARAYSYELDTDDLEVECCDEQAHEETWSDMVRLQNEEVYPAAFRVIDAPVLMLHGAADPHPGPLIRAGLAPYLPQLVYRELARSGHYPWLERGARTQFFAILRDWLSRPGAGRS
jgi:pimeloyl-ACP methyl ester carboxylesterase